ncbi:MAG: hypothetical protein V4638_08420 [Bacteroidota bacterium]
MKYKAILIFSFIVALFPAKAQINQDLTAETRAYLYHIVKRSEILDQAIGRYFDYKGPVAYFPNKEINYDSVELIIINQPELLLIRKEEIAKSTKGILAEAANKIALWELNKTLLAKRNSEKELEAYQTSYQLFEKFLMEKLPEEALREKDGIKVPSPKLNNLLNPGLSFDDKVAYTKSLRFENATVDKAVIDAISYAVNEYVKDRTLTIFRQLGGKTDQFTNILVAAGDGSGTSGMLNEKEKDEKGRWNKGLPKSIGFFPYQTRIDLIGEKKKEQVVEPMTYATIDMSTFGNERHTDLHFDVWGYNTEKQTTVVIERNGLSYPLFGSGKTRFLSPDSSFSDGHTLQAIINDLEFNKIAKMNELLYGKKGYDFQIEDTKKKKDEIELKIEKSEYGYSSLSTSTITTSKKAPRSVKKAKKEAQKSGGGPRDYQPTTDANQKPKRKGENNIVDLYNQFEDTKRKIARLELEKQAALDELAILKQRMDQYKRLIGYKWAPFTEEAGLYTFSDSCTFDLKTQEFRFPANSKKEDFEVRLIAIPESSLSKNADEVMLHLSASDVVPNKDARFQLELSDIFSSDQWDLNKQLIELTDSVAILQFFEALLIKEIPLKIIARGQGIGKWDGNRTVKNYAPVELNSYPSARNDSAFVRLRTSQVMIHLNREIRLEINSFTDPVKSNLTITDESIKSLMERYKLSKNDLLSAHRSASILKQLKVEVNQLAGLYLSREQAKIVIDRFNKEFEKARVSIGATSLKLSEL